MSKRARVLLELLAPPFAASLWLAVESGPAGTIPEMLLVYFLLTCFAYAFGIIPSAAYTIIMEAWLRHRASGRLGFLLTALLSTVLGAGAGFLSGLFASTIGYLIPSDRGHLARIGAFVGLLLGLVVGRWRAAAPPDIPPNGPNQ